ncbi:ABC transporter permease [Sinirhodobacter ferrireducens]|uniref:ABC transporter permease n=1 Tax=Paenirhodobacter ferrireducens TaxID=1215032 RepID=A0A443LT37_9RHOB|nr:ABC transporter permease [Sinirhodobacter ferrireducens]RWR52336.1 ABC transporter permease [Sinirhodobacter ferrireducens]
MAASPLKRWARSEAVNGYMMISPTLIYAILLLAAPLVTLVAYSFFTDGYLVVIPDLTTANYAEAWSDPIFRSILLRSVIVSGLVTLVTVVLAFPIAYFISFHVPAAKKSRWLFLITIPFWTSYLIRVFQWKVILNYNGVINSILTGLGLTDHPLQMLNSIGAISITLAHAYAPFAILPIFVSLEKIDRSLLEAGLDLGENRLLTFWRVTLPLAMPGVIGAVMIVFIPTIGDYVTPELIGGGKLPMVANVIYQQLLKIDNKPLGSAMAISAMLVVAAVALVFLFLNRRFLRGSK